MSLSPWIIIILLLILVFLFWRALRHNRRGSYIRTYAFPPGLFERLRKRRPELELKDCELVEQALRQFFLAFLDGGCRFVSMPSQVTDELWHELILYTYHYQKFCQTAFGRFLHHTPAVVLSKNRRNNQGLRRVWSLCCRQENINPRQPSCLPLLFAIDKKLNIADGFLYLADCKDLKSQSSNDTAYCGGDFSSTDIDGILDGFGTEADASDGGNGDGGNGGDGDGGCSGGCGGD